MNKIGLLILTATLIIGGCGSDDEKGSTSFVSSISADKPMSTLTASERLTMCEEILTYESERLTKNKESKCRLVGLVNALTSSASLDSEIKHLCQTAFDECMNKSGEASSSNCYQDPPPVQCTATIAEMGSCLTDRTAQSVQIMSSLPACNSMDSTTLSSATNIMSNVPSSCKLLNTKCPE